MFLLVKNDSKTQVTLLGPLQLICMKMMLLLRIRSVHFVILELLVCVILI